MSYHLLLTPQAEEQLCEGDTWWRANRPAARDLLLEEFESALELLREMPGLGSRFHRSQIPGVRRLLLRHTGY